MKKILFLMGLLSPVSAFAVTDSSANGNFYYVNFSLPGVVGLTSVHARSCDDAILRMNMAIINANSHVSDDLLFKKLLFVQAASTNGSVYNCRVTKGSQTGSGGSSTYTTVQITKNFGGSQPDLTSVSPTSIHHPNDCPSFYPLIIDNPSVIPEKMCVKSSPNGQSTKFCGVTSPVVSNPVSGAQVLYSLYQTFDTDAECGGWKNSTDLLTDPTRAKLDSLIDRSRDLFADESYTEDSRNSLFDVQDSISSDYPLTETQALSDIDRLEKAISDLKKVDGTDPDPDPDPNPDNSVDTGEVIQAIKDATSSIVSSITNSVSKVTSAISEGVSTLKSSLLDIKTSTDAIKTSVDAVKASTDEVKTSVDAVKASTDEVKTSVDAVKASTDEVKTSVDAVKTSTDEVKTSVDAVNDSVLSQGDRIVSAIRDIPVSQGGTTNVSVDMTGVESRLDGISEKISNGGSSTDMSGVESRLDEIKGFLSDFSTSLGELSGLSDSDLQPENVPVVKNASDLDVFKGGFKTDTFTISDQCPADIPFSMSFMGTPFNFSFSFAILCEKLAILGKLILIFSYFIALNIVLRAK